MGETAVSNVLETLGRRDTESRKFQDILLQSVKEIKSRTNENNYRKRRKKKERESSIITGGRTQPAPCQRSATDLHGMPPAFLPHQSMAAVMMDEALTLI